MRHVDVAILGGGIAGFSLARQLQQEAPSRSVVVLEQGSFPCSEATHKVGESTVEVGAHYLAEDLGLKSHLEEEHIRKFGVRYFFPSKRAQSFEDRREMGTRQFFPVRSYQLDRGRLENHLYDELCTSSVDVLTETFVHDIEELHGGGTIHYKKGGAREQLRARWIVDASGRTGLLRRRLQLQKKVPHDVNAVWFRLNHRIDIGQFAKDPGWNKDFKGDKQRWYSTNHCMGEGYWIWIIPLPEDKSSVGIVFDESMHAAESFQSYEHCISWLQSYEPELSQAAVGTVLDFRRMRHLAYDSSRVFSTDGWMLTGDAAAFLDPFYSPGLDFVAIANGCITKLIGGAWEERDYIRQTEVLNHVYKRMYEHFLRSYTGTYRLFGNPLVMPIKIAWDFAVYWTFIAYFFMQGRMNEMDSFRRSSGSIERIATIHEEMQDLFLRWHHQECPSSAKGLLDMTTNPYLWYLNESLLTTFSGDSFHREFEERLKRLESMASEIGQYYSERSSQESNLSARHTVSVCRDFLEQIGEGCETC